MGLRCYASATTSTPIEVDWNHTEIPSPFGIVEMNSAKVCPETNKYIQQVLEQGWVRSKPQYRQIHIGINELQEKLGISLSVHNLLVHDMVPQSHGSYAYLALHLCQNIYPPLIQDRTTTYYQDKKQKVTRTLRPFTGTVFWLGFLSDG